MERKVLGSSWARLRTPKGAAQVEQEEPLRSGRRCETAGRAMSKVLGELVKLLALERIEENLFRGQSQDLGWGTVFGGQVLGQALSAAVQTVPEERHVHSLHAYFMRPGDVSRPIVYDVDRARDGGSFTTRRVVAIQAGQPILNLAASFQVTACGLGMTRLASIVTNSACALRPSENPMTSSPMRGKSTPAPTAVTIPAKSLPCPSGKWAGKASCILPSLI